MDFGFLLKGWNNVKRTSLYETHVKCGARIIDFGGWEMPVQYGGIISEHEHVREKAGLFDVSHMGELLVEGEAAAGYLQNLITNDISKAKPGRAVYSPMCYPDGGVVDDLLVYKLSDTSFFVVVNAANTDKDEAWLREHLAPGVTLKNASAEFAQLAVQGPKAQQIVQRLTKTPLEEIRFYHFAGGAGLSSAKTGDVEFCGLPAIISRTGYTGEDGFEVYFDPAKAPEVWNKILDAGKDEDIVPAGLGARDTLRFEAALPLYGHELSESISPLEAGLGRFVKLNKESFIGREALLKQNESGPARRLAGIEVTGRGVARAGCELTAGGKTIGVVTTGSYAPSLKKNLGLALVDTSFAGGELEVVIRGKAVTAKETALPFYIKKYKNCSVCK